MIYVHRLQLFVNHVYNGTIVSVWESRHSPKKETTGFVVHVLSSYSVFLHAVHNILMISPVRVQLLDVI